MKIRKKLAFLPNLLGTFHSSLQSFNLQKWDQSGNILKSLILRQIFHKPSMIFSIETLNLQFSQRLSLLVKPVQRRFKYRMPYYQKHQNIIIITSLVFECSYHQMTGPKQSQEWTKSPIFSPYFGCSFNHFNAKLVKLLERGKYMLPYASFG